MQRFSGIILVDARGWLLLQERDEHPVIDPERWGLPGGHLDADESFEHAAYRELAEETGIALPDGGLDWWRNYEVFHQAYDSLDQMQVFVARCDLVDADIVVGEGRQIVFVEPERARGLDLTASAAMIVPDFLASSTYERLKA